ncbi:unnamed protein product [Acanthoscelides obtectus]|uniref:Uncharacterized protein n=1 Tax=Acanthoscelides obtectus TaxID=200917 RepID=A0A9P0MF40_ACAOB|nr:unnamed protein product [Acanthoscelides obtectus]CAK1626243.1 hypothetical protein AOBTE_LOCUS3708 [Acanthoscelides obtectus]
MEDKYNYNGTDIIKTSTLFKETPQAALFHKPYRDTCSRCDNLQNLIRYSTNEDVIKNAKEDLEKSPESNRCHKS